MYKTLNNEDEAQKKSRLQKEKREFENREIRVDEIIPSGGVDGVINFIEPELIEDIEEELRGEVIKEDIKKVINKEIKKKKGKPFFKKGR